MPHCSHIANDSARAKVRTFPADFRVGFSHYRNMARRGIPKQINWYLREWMAVSDLRGRGAQAEMMRRTGWSKATMSQLYNNTQDYSPKLVNEAAEALKTRPWELLMPPEEAMFIRRIKSELAKIARGDVSADDLAYLEDKDFIRSVEPTEEAKDEKERRTGTRG